MHFLWPLRRFSVFECPEGRAAYQILGRFSIMAGPPQAVDLQNQRRVMDKLSERTHREGRFLCGYYFSESLISDLVESQHIPLIRLGKEAHLSLNEMTLRGARWAEARRARNFVRRKSWKAEFAAAGEQLVDAKDIYKKWRRSKGIFKIGFLLGDISKRTYSTENEFSCVLRNSDGRDLAYVNYFVYRDHNGAASAYLDNLLYDPKAHRLALSGLLVELAMRLKAQGIAKINLGLCPFVITQPRHWIEWLFRGLYRAGLFYNSKGLFHFKKRFATSFEDQYLLLDSGKSLFAQLLQLSRASISS